MSGKATGWVLKHYPVTKSADRTRKLILLSVADAANQYGQHARPGLKIVCEEWNFGHATASRHLTALVAEGWLEVTDAGGGRGNWTEYRLPGMTPEPPQDEVDSETNPLISEPEPPQDSEETPSGLDSALSTPDGRDNGKEQRVAVFEAWKLSAGKNGNTSFTPERQRFVRSALKSYPLEDVLDAVRGWVNSPFHRGENHAGKVWNELSLLLRDGEHIEQFRDLWRNPPSARPVKRAAADDKLDMIAEHFGVGR